jgi:glucokinase
MSNQRHDVKAGQPRRRADAPGWVGVDLGGTNLRLGLVRGTAVLHEERRRLDWSRALHGLAPAAARRLVLRQLQGVIAEFLRAHPQAAAVGIGVPGYVDGASGRLIAAPNLPGIANLDLAVPLARALGLPVVVENDALCAAWGEYRRLRKPPAHYAFFGLGTGIGGGLVLHGQPFRGTGGLAMEAGHLTWRACGRACGCGRRGCVERYASASGLCLNYHALTGRRLEALEIARRARAGEAAAVQAIAQAMQALARLVAHLVHLTDVRHIAIGGGLSASWPLLAPPLHAALEAELIPALRGKLRLSRASGGDQAGIIGAALLAAATG